MRALFVAIGAIMLILGIIIIRFQFIQQQREIQTWNLVATRERVASFSEYLEPGYYLLEYDGGHWNSSSPPYIEIWNSSGNRIYRFDVSKYEYGHAIRNFAISSSDNYDFRLYRDLHTPGVEFTLSKHSISYETYHPYDGALLTGAIVLAAGLGAYAYGVIAKGRRIKGTPSMVRNVERELNSARYYCSMFRTFLSICSCLCLSYSA